MSDKQEYIDNEKSADIPIRHNLVNTAVNFLINPDVRKRHDDSKINFLKKKGLTDAEISAAFDRVGQNSNFTDTVVSPVPLINHVAPPYPFWYRLSRLSSSFIVFGVALYGLHHLYKKFVRPWLLGEDSDSDSELNRMKELTRNLTLLTETVEKLHAAVTKQNEDVNKLIQLENCGYAPTPVLVEDLKREVNSLKSILISRHQFPAIPQIQTMKATIPSWQLPAEEEKADAPQMFEGNAVEGALENLSSLDEELKALDSTPPYSGVMAELPASTKENGLVEDGKVDEE